MHNSKIMRRFQLCGTLCNNPNSSRRTSSSHSKRDYITFFCALQEIFEKRLKKDVKKEGLTFVNPSKSLIILVRFVPSNLGEVCKNRNILILIVDVVMIFKITFNSRFGKERRYVVIGSQTGNQLFVANISSLIEHDGNNGQVGQEQFFGFMQENCLLAYR